MAITTHLADFVGDLVEFVILKNHRIREIDDAKSQTTDIAIMAHNSRGAVVI